MPMCTAVSEGKVMAARERVVVLMSAAEKRALDAKATKAGRISAGELVRRAVDAYDADAAGEAQALRDLLGVLAGVHAQALRRLDATERKLDDTLAHLQAQGRPASAPAGDGRA